MAHSNQEANTNQQGIDKIVKISREDREHPFIKNIIESFNNSKKRSNFTPEQHGAYTTYQDIKCQGKIMFLAEWKKDDKVNDKITDDTEIFILQSIATSFHINVTGELIDLPPANKVADASVHSSVTKDNSLTA
ncbi:MAG: hypothetical protein OEY79_04465 [Anaplasmataceae bacterium]|nr:hypothetical protein [Anaplasmataceae bacterium]